MSGDINKGYFLYQICILFSLLIFLCSCRIPYSKASAVGGQPEREEKERREEGRKVTGLGPSQGWDLHRAGARR